MITAQNTFEPMIKRTFRIMRYVAVGPHQGTQALAEFSELDPAKAWLNDLIIAANEHTWEDGSSWRPTTNRCAVEFMLKDMELPAMRWWIVEDPGRDTS
jgi:hypothetical protein